MTALSETLHRFLRHYLLAVQFFTRIPVTGPLAEWTGFSPEMLRASATHFPGVGWLVGMAACVVFAVLSLGLPDTPHTALAAAVGCTIATVLMTGAFHEDGLADVADGLGGSAERERALEIMKDSRVGAFGAIALVLALAAKVAILAVLAAASPSAVLTGLLAAHTVSRFWPLVVIHTMGYVGAEGGSKSKPLAERIDRRALQLAALWCLVPLALMALAHGAAFVGVALAFSAVACYWMRRWFARRLQGFTGDCLGATQQVCEIAFYLGAAFGLAAR